jgi:hypothetical protein
MAVRLTRANARAFVCSSGALPDAVFLIPKGLVARGGGGLCVPPMARFAAEACVAVRGDPLLTLDLEVGLRLSLVRADRVGGGRRIVHEVMIESIELSPSGRGARLVLRQEGEA